MTGKRLLLAILTVYAIISGTETLSANTIDSLWFHKTDFTASNNLFVEPGKLGRPLSIAGKEYSNGLASPEGLVVIDLQGKGLHFGGMVGMDDNVPKGCVRFVIMGDRKELFTTPLMRKGMAPIAFDIKIKGVDKLYLIVENDGDGIHTAHADWINTYITYKGATPRVQPKKSVTPYILTPPVAKEPKINGAKVYGARPGHPFYYRLAVSGERPMRLSVSKLPDGLSFDSENGIITGAIDTPGTTIVKITAENKYGHATRDLEIVAGDKIGLTPTMGWSSWNCFGDAVTAELIKNAADALIKSGLANHGWSYINIDDGWSVLPNSTDSLVGGVARDANGMIKSNKKFPDMKVLTDYIHSLGLKTGIYSSPGETTCGRFTASLGHEAEDARQWSEWGIDFIKYDWCSYWKIYNDTIDIDKLKKPYIIMGEALRNTKRDIIYNLCQYGMGNVGKWGREMGGNSWRISRDVHDTWTSMSGIGFAQAGREVDAGPGHWNDVDMLVVGKVGWGPKLRQTRLNADEMYTHVSLWSLLTSPLLIGCDLENIDEFTLNLLTNDEVIAINQDRLGKQASRIYVDGKLEVWAKDMEDGSKAVGLFNRGIFPQEMKINWDALGLSESQAVRDVWCQQDLGSFKKSYKTLLPAHGVKLIIVRPE